MRVSGDIYPFFELIGEYEAPLLKLNFDDFMAEVSKKLGHRRFKPPNYPGKHLRSNFVN
jgi:hypothetical protein